ncbi:hypothetical protein H257_17822 [Aphanomyces astaci]|uniref:Uncharacterized protein n=1 Tax=Aphanomyces astaci TaxID=112090 RepID=W4FF40_APHAT|nr:hypothetical protein H257_17822 [Aphanomyces astaci]ETV65456.1 hypothetical protein H257_17822 [Aphanomyces astaci]|eukprot:XP_009845067.1 hypothetical protein H257_17822 [Aphanomyces astaci]
MKDGNDMPPVPHLPDDTEFLKRGGPRWPDQLQPRSLWHHLQQLGCIKIMTYTRRCCGCCRVITPAAGKVKRHVTYDFADSWSDNAVTPERLVVGRDGGTCHHYHHDHHYCPLDHVHCPPITTSRSPVTACPLRDLRHPVRHVDLITTRVTVGPVTTTTKAPTGHQRQA